MNLDHYIARTQRWVTVLYVILFSSALAMLVVLPKPLDTTVQNILIGALATLGNILISQNQFWYGRPRGGGVPDPGTTTISAPASIKVETQETTK